MPAAKTKVPITRSDLAQLRDELLTQLRNELLAEIRAMIDRQAPKSLLRIGEVQRRSGYGRSSIYAKVAMKEFPAPHRLGDGRAVGWRSDEVDAWINSRTSTGTKSEAKVAGHQPLL